MFSSILNLFGLTRANDDEVQTPKRKLDYIQQPKLNIRLNKINKNRRLLQARPIKRIRTAEATESSSDSSFTPSIPPTPPLPSTTFSNITDSNIKQITPANTLKGDINTTNNEHSNNNTTNSHNTENYTTNHIYEHQANGVMGLKNMGFTCYFNSVLQNLIYTKSALEFYLAKQKGVFRGVNGDLNNCLQKLINRIWFAPSRQAEALGPNELFKEFAKKHPDYRIGVQMDAQELLNTMLDDLNEEDKKNGYSSSTFSGLTTSSITCHQCKKRSQSNENFFMLSVEIPPLKEKKLADLRTGRTDPNSITLVDCLSAFTDPELLEGFNCQACSRHQSIGNTKQASKQLLLSTVPNILIVHLKRFMMTETYDMRKIETMVTFPATLDLTPFILPPKVTNNNSSTPNSTKPITSDNYGYQLTGVVVHSGIPGNATSGHYTAFLLNEVENKWYYADDAIVRESSVGEACAAQPYLLFYKRIV